MSWDVGRQVRDGPADLRSYLQVLSRRRWILVSTFFATLLATGVLTSQVTPIYEGIAEVEVLPNSISSEASLLLESAVDPTRGLETQVRLIRSDAVLRGAAAQLGLPSTSELRDTLSVELVPDTQIVEITVENPSPAEARDWTNAVANAYITFRRERALETSLAASSDITKDINDVKARLANIDPNTPDADARAERDGALAELAALEGQLRVLPDAAALSKGGGTIITSAELPREPVRPKLALNLALAAVVGAMLALGLAFLAESLDDRLKSPEEVERIVGAPVLGYIPLVKSWDSGKNSQLAVDTDAGSGATESYQTLMTNLRFVGIEEPLKTLLVTSPVAEAGKSTTAANLAATIALGGEKVILVSGDLRRPSLHKIFGVTNAVGLLDALNPRFPLLDALQEVDIGSLRLLAAGGLPPNPTQILDSVRFGQILSTLEDLAEVVIIDSAPVLGLGDASALASQVNGILLVLRTSHVTKREVAHAADQLRKAGGRIVGCILNAVEADDGYGYYYHYYYSQYESGEKGRTAV